MSTSFTAYDRVFCNVTRQGFLTLNLSDPKTTGGWGCRAKLPGCDTSQSLSRQEMLQITCEKGYVRNNFGKIKDYI
jgi:hypothetical protein